MKVNIHFPIKESAWGGGNQFLKALRNRFLSENKYTNEINDSEVILFNSHHCLNEILKLKYENPHIAFIHRVDGPMVHYRGGSARHDKFLFRFNHHLADGTIFQSQYSKNACLELGLKPNKNEVTILNAPDPNIFYKNEIKEFNEKKVKLIATSWSANPRKGFEVYKWLDENLDFNRYEMKFVGNSPVEFKNIIKLDPMQSIDLSKELRNSDIYITASQKDPCSNSLLEALHSGLPVIALRDGGHPEIVKNSGFCFEQATEIPLLLNKLCSNYHEIRKTISLPNIGEVSEKYYEFLLQCVENSKNGVKKIGFFEYYFLTYLFYIKKIWDYFQAKFTI